MYQQIINELKLLLKEASAHGIDHVELVYQTAMDLAEKEGADKETVMLAALLHDADDYKFVGLENSKKLLNAKKIMQKVGVSQEKQEIVCDIISNMGYSNVLKGIRPHTKEGAIVSDADMLDAMGAVAILRTIEYAASKRGKIFDPAVFPCSDLTVQSYQNMADGQAPAIHHFFDKLLKLKGLILTDAAKKEAVKRHNFMICFLKEFFGELHEELWLNYLEDYLKRL